MNTSYTLQKDVSNLLDAIRKRLYGEQARANEYRDSFILGQAILGFSLENVEELLLFKDEDNDLKVAKSVTLKADAYERLKRIAELLGLSESEACRLIIYYCGRNAVKSRGRNIPGEVEAELASLKKALDDANRALKAIEKYYEAGSKEDKG